MQLMIREHRTPSAFRWAPLVVLASVLLVGSAGAERDPRAFLEALKERGYHDMAIVYLERLATAPDAPADLKQNVDFEIAEAHYSAASFAQTRADAREHWAAAIDAYRKFIAEKKTGPVVVQAKRAIGLTTLSLADLLDSEVQLGARPRDEYKTQLEAMRKELEDARKLLQEAETAFVDAAKKLVDDGARDDPKQAAVLEIAQQDLLQTRLLLATSEEAIGLTYPPNSKEYKDHLTAAAEAYHDLFNKYKNRMAGLRAKLGEARIRLTLGEVNEAKSLVQELTIIEPTNETMDLLTESLLLLIKIDTHPKVKDYADAIGRIEGWREFAVGAQQSSMRGLEIHLRAAETRLAFARSLKEKNAVYRDQLRMARGHLEFVNRFSSPFKRQALTLLQEPEFATASSDEDGPQSFDEAMLAVGGVLAKLTEADIALRSNRDAAEQDRLTRARDDAATEAIDAYRGAYAMVEPTTPPATVNQIRRDMANLYYMRGDLYDSAVLGDTIARRYPAGEGAAMGLLAAKSYRRMALEARNASEDPSFAERHLEETVDYLMSRWGGSEEADDACILLIDSAIDQRDIDKAKALLDRIADDSPRRAIAELRLGQTLWNDYVNASKLEEDARPPREQLNEMVDSAEALFAQGIARVQSQLAGDAPDRTTALAVLTLAQIKMDRSKADEAVTLLNDPKVGPITLIEENSPSMSEDALRINAYMIALQAFVQTQQLDDAEKAMDALEALMGGGADASRLTRVYIALGRQLQGLLTRLQNEGRTEEVEKVTDGFIAFLDRIGDRDTGNDFASLNWVAETYYSMAQGLDTDTGETPEKAVKFYKEAGATYTRMLKKGEDEPGWMPDGAATTLRVRAASCLREIGGAGKYFELAMKHLLDILRESPMRVDVQMEAARTYQAWGRLDPEYYKTAMIGGEPGANGQNIVWGWAGIAKRVAAHEKYRDLYFESLYNKNLCRAALAVKQGGADMKDEFRRAETDIVRNHKMYPTMGGPEWFRKFDRLVVTLRQKQGQSNPEGLRTSDE